MIRYNAGDDRLIYLRWMNSAGALKNTFFYTLDHEWINFQGSVAYVGICAFKIIGIKQIDRIEFDQAGHMKRAGDILAIIHSGEYKIPVHMPVDGEVLSYNTILSEERNNILLQQPERNGWIAFIFPALLHEQHGLISRDQYQERNKPILL